MTFQTCKKIIRFRKHSVIFAGMSLFFFGALLALVSGAEFNSGKLILGLIIALSAVLSSQYSNEYFDQEVDSCESSTAFSGGSGILINNPELSTFFKLIAISLMAFSIIVALIFTFIFEVSPLLLLLVIGGNLLGWFYTAPPIRLSYHGWGELAFGVGDGFLIPAFGFLVFMDYINLLFLILVIPIIFYILAASLNKEIPDQETDKKGRKYTIIVRRGREFGFKVVAFLFFMSTLYYLILYFIGYFEGIINLFFITLLSLVTLTFGIIGAFNSIDNREKSLKYVNFNMMATKFIILGIDLYLLYILIK